MVNFRHMEVEFVTEETSDDENFGFDDGSEDYLNFDGERCGICMDVVIDRGVLDCCQHWFCFDCIDNWATITSLCPLCQNEFQLITCVPVYDTVGGNKTDDETSPRDDDWFIEGKSNNVSFPSYYIDENAVVCMDGNGCKIRSGSVSIEADSDIDTSIACDSCDKWYHAFCVGFDPEGSCDSSWLCPRCNDKGPNELDNVSLRKSYLNSLEVANCGFVDGASLSGRVLVSVADDGETAVVVSLIDENQESSQSASAFCKDKNMGNTFLPSSMCSSPKPEAVSGDKESVEPNSCEQGTAELNFSRDNHGSSSHDDVLPAELNTNADGVVEVAPGHLKETMTESGLDLDLDMKDNHVAEDKVPQLSEPNNRSQDPKPEKATPDDVVDNMMADEKLAITGITCAKRKYRDNRNAEGRTEANIEVKIPRKKMKAEKNSQPISNIMDQTAALVRDESTTISRQKRLREKENASLDIRDIVQGSYRKSLKKPGHRNSSDTTCKEGESAAGLRVKKIVRRAGDDKESSTLVQELRQKIREAVRNKSSEELVGKNRFDPKLLDAFRAALAGSGADIRKPPLDVRAKRSLLQKGKVRESLTKKIYGAGGKRKRAWTRECEVEFWKHRCMKISKPEKIQALKSVLDVLRDNNLQEKKTPENEEEETKGSILSRVYLADTSVFPRNNDIKPVANLRAAGAPKPKKESSLTGNNSIPSTSNQSDANSLRLCSSSQLKVLPLDGKETKKSVTEVKSALGGKKVPLDKEKTTKSDMAKGDKRQWALELLARKTAVPGKNMQEKEDDNAILKGNFTLLAQLPKEMRPVLAASRHNKIPVSVRQIQLYRLTEHFLKKANVSVVCRSAETELAVADAVNIEKQVADRSHSKLVYLNLCSQELSRRADDINSSSDAATEESNNNNNNNIDSSPLDLGVEEALRRAGLVSDSPPTSPNHPTDDITNDNNNNNYKVCSADSSDDEGPENVIEAEPHSELDIYGDFEYSLEDDDFIGAGSLSTNSKPQPEPPKLKLLFSSIKPEKSDEKALAELSGPVESRNDVGTGGPDLDNSKDEGLIRNSAVDDSEKELLMAECEELYGPDKEPLVEKYPLAVSDNKPFDGLSEENGSNKRLGQIQSPSNIKDKNNAVKKDRTAKADTKPLESSMIMKKVEAYIKEHVRPLCKSGVITVEQYRWAVGKTTEKVMKYHSKEKNANFLIKEGEKVKKLAEQYVEASQQLTKCKPS
ncbi:Uncharacterized protein SHERM_04842 [Striga hermonthica]|uniref:RING/U-box protein n=1 Tax=Striga hermonthica TaxID=68872 RepID=A0A9N7NVT9_STRHE|nr:Uncharacterized protein SHERM_04842 [Striga hermonthica]